MAEFVYQMYQARKAHGDKVILDDVTLSFYPGAKIGVVGPNGMGKSTLLKIMAGLEDVSNGEARLTPGYTVGILQQEPPLDEDKTVLENIQMAFGDVLAKIDRFNEIGAEMADPDADFDALMAETPKRPSQCSPAANAGAWHSASSCSKRLTCFFSTNQRTTSMRNRCSGSSSSSRATPARCSRSRMIATSWTT